MNEFLDKLGFSQFLKSEIILDIIWAALTLTIGLILAWLISRGIARILRRRLKAHEAMLVKRLSYYLLFSLVIIATLHQLGIDLGLLLGAAGILSVAIGFASQTSASNVISGIFLIAERPFVI